MAAAEPLSPAEAEALVRALRGTELRDAGGKGCGERARLRGGHTGPGRGEGCGGINSRCPSLRRWEEFPRGSGVRRGPEMGGGDGRQRVTGEGGVYLRIPSQGVVGLGVPRGPGGWW